MITIDGHEHDGVRRWAISYYTDRSRKVSATFYSDAKTITGAQAHLTRSTPGHVAPTIRSLKPDTWLHR